VALGGVVCGGRRGLDADEEGEDDENDHDNNICNDKQNSPHPPLTDNSASGA
jgi:hypothetical protein